MEVFNHLGSGFSEIVYKDALEYEFREKGIDFEREKEFRVTYKDMILPHYFFADFVVMDKIILEAKTVSELRKDKFRSKIVTRVIIRKFAT
jgi:GxxExxY protein